MKGFKLASVCGFVLAVMVYGAFGEITLPNIFSDHMVLQRDAEVPVWGKAEPGEKVTVEFAGQKVSVKADADGKWRVKLRPLDTSLQGRTLTVTGKSGRKVFNDVRVGEVWVCSGQSNMQFGVGGVPELRKLMPQANKMPIYTFEVARNVALQPEDNCIGTWRKALPSSAVAFGFAYYLQKAMGVPVGIILTCWGSSSLEGWMPLEMTKDVPAFKKQMEQFNKRDIERTKTLIAQAADSGKKKPEAAWQRKDNIFLRTRPNLLYNAMLHPVIPYAVRGMVWYQGEANTKNVPSMEQYGKNLRLWLEMLRKRWQNKDFELLVVMLPGYGNRIYGNNKDLNYPANGSWARMRESQLSIQEVPHAAVANTIDLGNAKNIHPHDKAPVCQRLVLLARQDAYGEKVEARGPVFKSSRVDGNKMIITFDHADKLTTKDGKPPMGFWLAGKDQQWHPATARIDGLSVVLQAEGVAEPVACRYAYAAKPDVNLVNGAGLPAYPFRTDDWPFKK